MNAAVDARWMRKAISEAWKGLGKVSPNPMVGAVLATPQRILAKAHHACFGGPHAEQALFRLWNKKIPRDASLYLTLEPCFHHGKTPPCIDVVLASGVRRVVIAQADPNPMVAGRSLRRLRQAGIDVILGVERDAAQWQIRGFRHWVVHREPYHILKVALFLDGTLGRPQKRVVVTGPKARAEVMKLRSKVDLVASGARTVLWDRARLTVRGLKKIVQPRRLVVEGQTRLTSQAPILKARGGALWLASPQARSLQGVDEWIAYRGARKGELSRLSQILGDKGITSVLWEAGSLLSQALVQENLVSELRIWIAPRLPKVRGTPWLHTEELLTNDWTFRAATQAGQDIQWIYTRHRFKDEHGSSLS